MASLAGLRRLSQPYFLPLEAGAGSFALLLAFLVAVGGRFESLTAIGSVGFQRCFLSGVAGPFPAGGDRRGHGPLARTDRLGPAGFGGGWGSGLLELSGPVAPGALATLAVVGLDCAVDFGD
jgi:hypothetical protein